MRLDVAQVAHVSVDVAGRAVLVLLGVEVAAGGLPGELKEGRKSDKIKKNITLRGMASLGGIYQNQLVRKVSILSHQN